ncbi:ACL054Wp [Eremothecium gossypii ATCC 10895]|uniref:Serine/threonine-protein kinase ATG1 n=1 Tax=Eremothecium gossypii (strain ATCC 10895 / CBS 109.51 / FGSC 9923 / NRRL Y-1056) TaxID=284811 RepID=ATG1_EREGS|nr:ACL054Wp [Eremothecium gossypii ATCC 10895]Q75CH3.1 RecName: Full=Serine/threonine-protein kinase ATG1; AltName: Full=Autophagy-related protein 1 [Eremothecium gossypii ATCC 10895]AAS51174.1 ACL054Wp [Eremothecium gossypii ATCC 10895]
MNNVKSGGRPVAIVAERYVVEKEIGRGSFAVVYKGHLADSSAGNVAIKAVSRSKLRNKKLLENLEIEIAILKKIKHPHIVGLLECERTGTDFYLMMEYCALGDLTFFIKKRRSLMDKHPLVRTLFEKYPPPSEHHNGLNRVLVVNYLQQLSSALKFLRSKNLVHRDIKPQNLLLSTPLVDYNDPAEFHARGFVGIYNLPILKIADFGFARFLPNTSLAETLCGSPLYMAPEILNYQKYNAKADLWSVGTVLYEMCCGKPPFKASNHLELFQKIKKANDVIQFPKHAALESAMVDLICGLLTFEPAKRMGFTEFFSNGLVNEDLSPYEVESEPDLETKSKNVAESNMFISEYLPTAERNKRASPIRLGDSCTLRGPCESPQGADPYPQDNTQSDQHEHLHADYSFQVEMGQDGQQADGEEKRKLYNNQEERSNEERQFGQVSNGRNQEDQLLLHQGRGQIPCEQNRQALQSHSHVAAKQIPDKDSKSSVSCQKHAASAPTKNDHRTTRLKEKTKCSYSDLLLEKEYVVVEKKSVEVNALADEFAQAGSGAPAIRLPDQHHNDASQALQMARHSSTSVSAANTAKQTLLRRNSRTLSSSGASTSRRPSLVDRRLSITSLGATNALSKALGMASLRLFGNSHQQSSNGSSTFKQNPNVTSLLSPQTFQDMTENAVLSADHQWDNSRQADVLHDDSIMKALENLTAKVYAIYSFAEVKFSQIIPLPPSSTQDPYTHKRMSNGSCAIDDEEDDIEHSPGAETYRKNSSGANANTGNYNFSLDTIHEMNLNDLPPNDLYILCTEAIVLYMKSLSLLAYAMHLTSKWWHESADKICPLKLNLLVQWIRERFNECLEKAEFLRMKTQSIQLHNGNQLSASTMVSEPVFVEKLIYDRALDISKTAAKMEMQGEYLEGCEVAYSTSLWMLEALLDDVSDEDNYNDDNLGHTGVLDKSDKEVIKRYIDSIANRLKALRRKLSR